MKRTALVLLASGLIAGCGTEQITGGREARLHPVASPIFIVGGIPVFGDEGAPVSLQATSTHDVSAGPLSVEWDFGDGSPVVSSASATGELSVTHTWDDNTEPYYVAYANVTDAEGGTEQIRFDVTINNLDPTAILVAPATVNAGASFSVSLDSLFDPSTADLASGLSFAFDCGDGNGPQDSPAASMGCAGGGPGWRTLVARVSDKDGGTTWRSADVEIVDACVAPGAVTITAPSDPVQLGWTVDVVVAFTDASDAGTSVTLLWSDGVSATATPAGGVATFSRSFAAASVYTATATVNSACGTASASTPTYVVIYDPNGGFVTGGGWINAAPGSYTADPSLGGKTTFGFVAKYQKGATVPTGHTEFQFHANGLDFKSVAYDWLVIAGSRAQYKGSGTIKGRSGSFNFLLTAIDGGPGGATDAFRMKILDPNGGVVFDNKQGASDTGSDATQLAGGSISIKKQ